MADLPTPETRFDGIGVTAGDAGEAARALAERLSAWSASHPGRRILQLEVQSAAGVAGLQLTALIAYLDAEETGSAAVAEAATPIEEAVEAVSSAEAIIADAQERPPNEP